MQVLDAPAALDGEPMYLCSYDPDARGGEGAVVWTDDLGAAQRFPSVFEAGEEWRRQSTVQPLRRDGRPNRPLSAFTVTFVHVDE